MRTLDERARISDLYLRVITLPLLLSGAAAVIVRTLPSSNNDVQVIASSIVGVLGVFFVLCFLSGVAAFLYYAMESANSRLYILALQAIRNEWRFNSTTLKNSIVIDTLRPDPGRVADSIVAARGAVFVLFNTAVGVSGLALFLLFVRPTTVSGLKSAEIVFGLIVVSVLSIALHILTSWIATNGYGRSSGLESARQQIKETIQSLETPEKQ